MCTHFMHLHMLAHVYICTCTHVSCTICVHMKDLHLDRAVVGRMVVKYLKPSSLGLSTLVPFPFRLGESSLHESNDRRSRV